LAFAIFFMYRQVYSCIVRLSSFTLLFALTVSFISAFTYSKFFLLHILSGLCFLCSSYSSSSIIYIFRCIFLFLGVCVFSTFVFLFPITWFNFVQISYTKCVLTLYCFGICRVCLALVCVSIGMVANF